jgi:stage IV sporulation protein B
MRPKQRVFLLTLVLLISWHNVSCASVASFGFPAIETMKPIDTSQLELVPCGMTIGVRINTRGIMVLGVSWFKDEYGVTQRPSEGKLRPGDLILRINGTDIKHKEELVRFITVSEGALTFEILRDGKNMAIEIIPAVSADNHKRAIGVYVRDSTKGIGTVTYYDPVSRNFGALGHGIMDVDTKRLMSVESGIIMPSRIKSIKKGSKGIPGELEGEVQEHDELGRIHTNSPCGIFGKVGEDMAVEFPRDTVKVASTSQIHDGPATIRTNVVSKAPAAAGVETDGMIPPEGSDAVTGTVREYDIYIESVNRFSADDTKGMVLRITDPELLALTNGIVQGMSGSPILQDGMLIGAVTHVFVQDPAKGYGIFIENMIRHQQGLGL